MKGIALSAALGLLLVESLVAEVDLNPAHFGSYMDIGQAVKTKTPEINDFQPLSRLGFFVSTSGSYDGKLDVALTLGGLYWNALPPQDATQVGQLFGFGIGEAQGLYKFGDPEEPFATLQMGLFSHKYNPDAKNLGEYLYRSGTYPGYLWTGGWSWLNSASYLAQGIRFTLPMLDGMLTHDLTFYQERDLAPANDITPSYQLSFKPSAVFEAGFGVAWAHAISFRPDSVIAPNTPQNAYFHSTGLPLTPEQIASQGEDLGYAYYGPDDTRNDSRVRPDGDPEVGNVDSITGDMIIDSTTNGIPVNQVGFYTFRGFKGMFRAGLDLGVLMEMEPNAFKLYGEVALLGFKDYPFYYDKKSERMPVMFGINIPTFGILDAFSIEAEYLNSPLLNTVETMYFSHEPLPLSEVDEHTNYRRERWKEVLLDPSDPDYAAQLVSYDSLTAELQAKADKSPWKWTVYAKRELFEGVTLTGQVARDHNRFFSYVFGQPTGEPATLKAEDWYWVLRLEFGI